MMVEQDQNKSNEFSIVREHLMKGKTGGKMSKKRKIEDVSEFSAKRQGQDIERKFMNEEETSKKKKFCIIFSYFLFVFPFHLFLVLGDVDRRPYKKVRE